MARTATARINPALLIWARESLGLPVDEAARRIGVKEDRLREWEAGESAPTVAQLRKAGGVLKRPLAVFYLPEPPRDFDAMKDFRRLADAAAGAWSPELHAEFRRARFQREVALELVQQAESEVAPVRLSIQSSDPEEVGEAMRALLGVGLSTQFSWRDRYRALAGWIEAVEDVGVLVLQTSDVDLEEMRGFSLAADVLPVIVVNAKDSPRGRIFTLLHELGHVLLRNGGLCDLSERHSSAAEARTETFCNQAAAATLMPRRAFASEGVVRNHPASAEWADDELAGLAEKYGVSREAVLRRLVSLGAASIAYYERKREEFLRVYAERRQQESGYAPYHRVKVRDLGRAYVRLVLDAYYREDIGASALADSLGIRLKHLPKIEAEVLGPRV
jgi:Zn-dependent peptidase ImmA (M78 family)